jgi:hypothetical protein
MDNVVLSNAAAIRVASSFIGTFTVQYVRFTGTSINIDMLSGSGRILYNNVNFAGAATFHIRVAYPAAYCASNGNHTISANAVAHVSVAEGGFWGNVTSYTVTLTGTPAWSGQFLRVTNNGTAHPAPGTTFSGAATGARYLANTGGGIQTDGSGASFLPGNSAGTATSPGWYA